MKINKVTIEFDMTEGDVSVRKLRNLLDSFLDSEESVTEEINEDFESEVVTKEQNGQVDSEHIQRLVRFQTGLTTKQRIVWDYFIENPGVVYSDDLRNELPILEKQGALSGVFRATRRWVALGGEKETSPFVQVAWAHERGGQYRGLTEAEVLSLRIERGF